jgi:hypothetical protein
MLSILTLGDPLYMGMYVLSLFIKLTMQIGSKHQRVKSSVCVCERERERERDRQKEQEVTFEFGIIDSCFVRTVC